MSALTVQKITKHKETVEKEVLEPLSKEVAELSQQLEAMEKEMAESKARRLEKINSINRIVAETRQITESE